LSGEDSVSDLFRSGSALRRVQALAAVLWIAYGIAIASKPVVVANLIVAVAAVGSAVARRGGRGSGQVGMDAVQDA
jgi:hypothetical protein